LLLSFGIFQYRVGQTAYLRAGESRCKTEYSADLPVFACVADQTVMAAFGDGIIGSELGAMLLGTIGG
jgi:hypothetical protein